jgi:acetyltransferase-like isoleucine patch superfamily enzyme/coenzyme F420-reducing hydrogenase beta subunit
LISITDKKDCCGCNACGDICSQNAVSFNIDIEGFWYPEVDREKCTNCGLCEKICPILHANELKKNDLKQSICYAAEHKNIEIVFDSTSGGAFSALADIMYKGGGYVGGAIFNDDFSVRHFISNNKKDITRIRGSKYLQSDLTGFYSDVKQLAESNEQILVCGCPCQMAALRTFLMKNYTNLIIVDFICRCINSPKVWRKYLDSFEERYGSPVVYSRSKSKELGWRNLTQKVILANGKSYYEKKDENNYIKGYLGFNIISRPSCYDCQFRGFPRIADITIADYWGIEKIKQNLDKNLGTSLIMLNSQKGIDYFEKIKANINYIQTPFESALKGNPILLKSPQQKKNIDRQQFFEDLDKLHFTQLAKKYFSDITLKKKLKLFLRLGYNIISATRIHPVAVFQLLKYNHYFRCFPLFWNQKGFIPATHCMLEISKNANFVVNGLFKLGIKRIKKSKLETRVLIENGAALVINGTVTIMYGAHIEVFKRASLEFGGNNSININCTIICAERIVIGKEVGIGRNVTIRDNNGGHYLNRQGYKNSRPVIIEDKAWLCEGCTIMPGVHIGEGAIIGAHAFVITNVPAHTLVTGNPARVIDEDILWK